MNTVLGADPLPQRQEDLAAAKRRANVQMTFELNQTKTSLMEAMAQYDISVTELAQALDYKLDAIAYLRDLGVPDGFQGLRVWPQADLDRYYEWHDKTPNALGLKVGRPSLSVVQGVMDREFANHAINPAHQVPWLV